MESPPTSSPLRQSLGALEYFTFGFGSMVGVGWLVIMDDWLGRGGPGGAMLGFLGGALLLLPIALTYGRLVRAIPDAGAEIAYTERVFPRPASFAAGWMMVLAYAIVCPWEAVAIGNLLARIVPAMNDMVLYSVAGKAITLPRLVAGLVLTALIGVINHRGIRTSGRFQDAMTLGLLACFAVFVVLGASRGNASNVEPLFAAPGPFVSVLLVAQIVPYFMTGFESIPKASEEARPDLGPHTLSRTITVAMIAGGAFYVLVIGVVAWVYPWREIVGQHLGTEAAFARAFGNTWIARLILRRVAFTVQDLQRQPRRGHAPALCAGTARDGPSLDRHHRPAVRDSVDRHPARQRTHCRGGLPRRCVARTDHRGRLGGFRRRLVRGMPGVHRARTSQR